MVVMREDLETPNQISVTVLSADMTLRCLPFFSTLGTKS